MRSVAVDMLAQARDELEAARANGGGVARWVERWADGLLDAAAAPGATPLLYWTSLAAAAHDGLRANDADKRERGALALGRLRESLITATATRERYVEPTP